MKVLVIPDIHLKPWIFDEADKIIDKYNIDNAVFIGDLVDDWGKTYHIDLYKDTIERAELFKCMHKNSLFCYGNHEVAYIVNGKCSGNSEIFRSEIKYLLNKYERVVEPKVIHKIDNVVFSHAGIENKGDKDTCIEEWNNKRLKDVYFDLDSPLWLRPYDFIKFMDFPQVIGHTPVEQVIEKDNVWFVDTFSTYSNGKPFGNNSFMIIDTISLDATVIGVDEI